uniref:Transmembrane protein n=1 Tax=Anopheles atroparvus TaxID=41427 RepID=A0AAG5CP69_ANOAO
MNSRKHDQSSFEYRRGWVPHTPVAWRGVTNGRSRSRATKSLSTGRRRNQQENNSELHTRLRGKSEIGAFIFWGFRVLRCRVNILTRVVCFCVFLVSCVLVSATVRGFFGVRGSRAA